ncbi:hypothetical protein D3C80_1153340 [compost metagenome]
MGNVHGGVGRLGDEHSGHGQVDGGAIEVERVTGRDDQAHHRLLGSQALQFHQHARQRRFRRGSTQHDHQLFTDVADELYNAEAVSTSDTTEHHQDEQHAGDVEAQHQLAQLYQRTHAVLADGKGHGAEGTDGCQLHDHVDDVEHHMGEAIDQVQQRLAVGTQAVQGKTEDHREHQHLEDIAVGEGTHNGVRDDIEQKAHGGLLRACRGIGRNTTGIERGDIDVHTSTRLDHVDHDQADDQGDGRDNFEVQQRITAGLADRLHVLHASDATDHGTEDDRGDDHFDQLDEPVTQRLERHAGLGIIMAKQNTDGNRDDYLEIQGFVQWLTSRHGIFLKCIGGHQCPDAVDT